MSKRSALSIFILLLLAVPLAAQVDHASLNGSVTDASGALIQGANVQAVSSATGFRRQAATRRRLAPEAGGG